MSLPAESDWTGLVAGHRAPGEPIVIRVPLQPARRSTVGSFLALASDGSRWWVKPAGQGDLDRTLVVEFVVSRAGTLIGAPTCQGAVAKVPSELEGWEFKRGGHLRPGLGHATRNVDQAVEERRNLAHRDRDDNRMRQAGIFALYDWCWGSDEQWLYSTTADMTIFSHDHGLYLPPSGAGWSRTAMRDAIDIPHELGQPVYGLDPRAVETFADELDKVDRAAIVQIMRAVPGQWPVDDGELETIGWFLERRAPAVADRLRALGSRKGV